jgi:hypothetical protein
MNEITDVEYKEKAGDPEGAVDLPVTEGRDVTTNTPDTEAGE